MARKMLFLLTGMTIFLVVFLLIATSVMNRLQINNAANQCKEIGGSPNVEKDLFAINWSFSCDVD
ncbi:hypothetical protein [Sediminibacillus halophilus]|uniref:Uncharacterized protein n=1 Tax=Sediminibacillus halophilus TaxID=482461 RepID=A0A1G9NQU5_9BACI|nr:hypothetical protein [Sediminibacillus halophilus]SDL88952.1 hypothetical protein SAMN05216244_1120 [Sediminibacillus halophilus]